MKEVKANTPLDFIVDILTETGYPLERLFSRSGITEGSMSIDALNLPQKCHLYRTAIAQLETIVCESEKRTPLGFEGFKLLIFCVIHAPDLRSVLKRIIAFHIMLGGNRGKHFLIENGETATYEMDTERRTLHPGAFLVDQIGLASLHSLLSWLVGAALPVSEVRLACPQEYEHLSKRVFRAPVTYDTSVYGISFSRSWLDAPILRTYTELEAALPLFPYDLMLTRVFSETFSDRLELLITNMLRKGEALPTSTDVARLLHMSESTFYRRCREEGGSYKQVKDKCLLELACECLRNPEYDIEEIALMLGFGEARSFRRAFKRWTGISPSEYR